MPLTEEVAAQVHHLISGAEKVFDNAKALYSEASILANSKAWSRALFLHQIASEECAKVVDLGAAVTALLMGREVNLRKLKQGFRHHQHKNHVNAFYLPMTDAEQVARDSGDFDAAHQEFKQVQEVFHHESNSDKNASLYVDFGDAFTSPQELIDEDVFARVRQRNDEFMSIASDHVSLLRGWSSDLKGAAEKINQVLSVLDKPDASKGDQEQLKAFVGSLDEKMQDLMRQQQLRL